MVLEFKEKISSEKKTKTGSDINFVNSSKKTFRFGSQSLTKSGSSVDSVNIYTLEIEQAGEKGFAIVTGDERIGQVFAYVEKGSISDSIDIKGMQYYISMIPALCELDLFMISKETSRLKAGGRPGASGSGGGRAKSTMYGPFIRTEWHQRAPYNNSMIFLNCSERANGRALAGCGAISLAQVIAYYAKPTGLVPDFSVINSTSQVPDNPILHDMVVGPFVRKMADGIGAKPGCDGTSSHLKDHRKVLDQYGYRYYYNSENVKHDVFLNSMRSNNVVFIRGTRSDGSGHVWVVDGCHTYTRSGQPEEVNIVHINWGWGGYCNGWYRDFNISYDIASNDWSNPSVPYILPDDHTAYTKNNECLYMQE